MLIVPFAFIYEYAALMEYDHTMYGFNYVVSVLFTSGAVAYLLNILSISFLHLNISFFFFCSFAFFFCFFSFAFFFLLLLHKVCSLKFGYYC